MQEVGGFTIGREMLMSHSLFKLYFSHCDLNEVKVWKELAVEYKSVMFLMESQPPFLSLFFIFLKLFHCPVFSKVVYNWHVHIQLSCGCVWRPRSVALGEQGRLPDYFFILKNKNKKRIIYSLYWAYSGVTRLNCSWFPTKQLCALKFPALLPAMWVPEQTSVGELSTFDNSSPDLLHWWGFLGRFSLCSKCMRGSTFPKETHWSAVLIWMEKMPVKPLLLCRLLAGYFVSILNYLN